MKLTAIIRCTQLLKSASATAQSIAFAKGQELKGDAKIPQTWNAKPNSHTERMLGSGTDSGQWDLLHCYTPAQMQSLNSSLFIRPLPDLFDHPLYSKPFPSRPHQLQEHHSNQDLRARALMACCGHRRRQQLTRSLHCLHPISAPADPLSKRHACYVSGPG